MGYIATQHLKFGSETLEPGDPVPVEPGRDYPSMMRLGQIVFTEDPVTTAKAKAHAHTSKASSED